MSRKIPEYVFARVQEVYEEKIIDDIELNPREVYRILMDWAEEFNDPECQKAVDWLAGNDCYDEVITTVKARTA